MRIARRLLTEKDMSNRLSLIAAAVTLCAQAQSQAAVILTQIDPLVTAPNSTSSQIFEAGFANFNSAVIDDFTVAVPTTLDSVSVAFWAQNGFASFAQVTAWHVEVYSSIGSAVSSLTGDVAGQIVPNASATLSALGANANNFQIVTLPISMALPASGIYYIGVLAVLDFAAGGQVFVAHSAGSGGDNGTLVNPGGGFALAGNQQSITGDAFINLSGTVPEPAGAGLLAAGMVLAGFRRRR